MLSLQVRFSFASSPILIRSYEWAKNGTYMGVTREEEGSYYFSVYSRHFDEKIQKNDEKIHINMGGLYYLCTRI